MFMDAALKSRNYLSKVHSGSDSCGGSSWVAQTVLAQHEHSKGLSRVQGDRLATWQDTA